jgi:hypothetical protein
MRATFTKRSPKQHQALQNHRRDTQEDNKQGGYKHNLSFINDLYYVINDLFRH